MGPNRNPRWSKSGLRVTLSYLLCTVPCWVNCFFFFFGYGKPSTYWCLLDLIYWFQKKSRHIVATTKAYFFSSLSNIQYSTVRDSMINHCDRCTCCITHLGDLDISFVLLNISSKFLLHLEWYLLSPKRHIEISK
jgi:hypothetical protein